MSQLALAAIVVVGFFVALLFLIPYSLLFGLITFGVSLVVVGRLEYERNMHDIGFYTHGKLSAASRTWFLGYALVEVLGRSLVFGILPVVLFSGTNGERISSLAWNLAVCVVVGYICLVVIKSCTPLDVTRWGYARLSIMLGLLLSILKSSVPGDGLVALARRAVESWFSGTLPLDEAAESLYGVLYQVDAAILKALQTMFGPAIGSLLSFAFSVNVGYGFIVFLYSLLLMHVVDWVVAYAVQPPVRVRRSA